MNMKPNWHLSGAAQGRSLRVGFGAAMIRFFLRKGDPLVDFFFHFSQGFSEEFRRCDVDSDGFGYVGYGCFAG